MPRNRGRNRYVKPRTPNGPNREESTCAAVLGALGFRTTKRGWPDLFCIDPKTRGIVCVEVKRDAKDVPTKHQRFVTAALASLGIPCYVWTRAGGFVAVKPYGKPATAGRLPPGGPPAF